MREILLLVIIATLFPSLIGDYVGSGWSTTYRYHPQPYISPKPTYAQKFRWPAGGATWDNQWLEKYYRTPQTNRFGSGASGWGYASPTYSQYYGNGYANNYGYAKNYGYGGVTYGYTNRNYQNTNNYYRQLTNGNAAYNRNYQNTNNYYKNRYTNMNGPYGFNNGNQNYGYNNYNNWAAQQTNTQQQYKQYPAYTFDTSNYPAELKGPIEYSLIGRDGRRKDKTNESSSKSSDSSDTSTKKNDKTPMCKQNEIEKKKRFAYHKGNKLCYLVGSKGPCKDNMRFYLEEAGSEYGACDCDANVGYTCGRPLVYWKKQDWCYPINSQGPCNTTDWLVLNVKGEPECKPNICRDLPQYRYQKDEACEHVVSSNGKCYETSTQGYCLPTEELAWDVFDSKATAPQCQDYRKNSLQNEPTIFEVADSWLENSSSPSNERDVDPKLPCLPGQKQTIDRKCVANKKKVRTARKYWRN